MEKLFMPFAVLDYTDYVIIAAIVAVLTGGMAAVRASFGPINRALVRVENKLDMLLKHSGLVYPTDAKKWQTLADEGPLRKIGAITAYREQTGAGLADAKRAVEEYIEGRR
jgi:ribosomal protein L7/L12